MNLKQQLINYQCFNMQEENDRKQILYYLDHDINILTRDNEQAHLTVSAWILNSDHNKVLMAYHNLYHSWAWLGGHADGNDDLIAVAYKEIKEESGIEKVRLLDDNIFSLEVLCVDGHMKKGKYVSSHLHLNITYLFEADDKQDIRIKEDENSAIGWIAIDDIRNKVTEQWFMDNIYQKLIDKITDDNN